ncbi:hypothetical protein B0H14DRAFT_2562241 [Mycena olivaceomarginata]|nr:hypothetical protein B0H14DRAFT_2562241 [Mycena olivaceomarginata]
MEAPEISEAPEASTARRKIRLFTPPPPNQTPTWLRFNPPPAMISDAKSPTHLILQQHTQLVQDAGYERMLQQISFLRECEDPGKPAREAAACVEAARHAMRRLKKDAESRACYEKMMRTCPPPHKIRLYSRHGHRTARETPLTEEDLYLDDVRPVSPWFPPLQHTCNICLYAKSHSVKLPCGHTACYVCVRLLLETRWDCEICGVKITRKPECFDAEAAEIELRYPGWDGSTVAYSWAGLMFPRAGQEDD